MNTLTSFVAKRPILFLLGSTLAWFILLILSTGLASSALRQPYGDPASITVGHLAVSACVLLLLRRLGWLAESGVGRIGSWRGWLIALAGLVYFSCASLYSLYGQASLDLASPARLSASLSAVATHFAAGLNEEVFFRGLLLYGVARAWGSTTRGLLASVVVTSLLFAALHITQVSAFGLSLSAAVLLVLETCVISVWWGALVLFGRSVWPTVMLHFVVNAVVAVQGLTTSIVEPEMVAYTRLFWFSLPLGVIGVGLLLPAVRRPIATTTPQKEIPD